MKDDEYEWLRKACPYFTEDYLAFLRAYRFNPRSEVSIRFEPHPSQTGGGGDETGSIQLRIKGKWSQAILYEVPILAIVSEAYFATVDVEWDYRGQVENAKRKMAKMVDAGCAVTDFGTRRRRSYHAQDLVLSALADASRSSSPGKGRLAGTSNVHFAMKYGLQPVGTIAHEMIMGVAALSGYPGSNGRVLDLWEDLYKGELTIALTDTFSTKPFWEDFCADVDRAKRWKGLRQDSGDPATFARMAKAKWQSMGVDPKSSGRLPSDEMTAADRRRDRGHRLLRRAQPGKVRRAATPLRSGRHRLRVRRRHQPDQRSVLFPSHFHRRTPLRRAVGQTFARWSTSKTGMKTAGASRGSRDQSRRLSTLSSSCRRSTTVTASRSQTVRPPLPPFADESELSGLGPAGAELTKNTGDEETVMMVKRRFGLEVGMSKGSVASRAMGDQAVDDTPAGSPIW